MNCSASASSASRQSMNALHVARKNEGSIAVVSKLIARVFIKRLISKTMHSTRQNATSDAKLKIIQHWEFGFSKLAKSTNYVKQILLKTVIFRSKFHLLLPLLWGAWDESVRIMCILYCAVEICLNNMCCVVVCCATEICLHSVTVCVLEICLNKTCTV